MVNTLDFVNTATEIPSAAQGKCDRQPDGEKGSLTSGTPLFLFTVTWHGSSEPTLILISSLMLAKGSICCTQTWKKQVYCIFFTLSFLILPFAGYIRRRQQRKSLIKITFLFFARPLHFHKNILYKFTNTELDVFLCWKLWSPAGNYKYLFM